MFFFSVETVRSEKDERRIRQTELSQIYKQLTSAFLLGP